MTTNNLNTIESNSGLYYVINEAGTGEHPTANDNVTVAYKGHLLDGSVFDENKTGYTTNLQNVISGWTEGIPYFKTRGNGILLIPPNLEYGAAGAGNRLPGGAVLIFDVNLISIN